MEKSSVVDVKFEISILNLGIVIFYLKILNLIFEILIKNIKPSIYLFKYRHM